MTDNQKIDRTPAYEAMKCSQNDVKYQKVEDIEAVRKYYSVQILPFIIGNPACVTPAQKAYAEDRIIQLSQLLRGNPTEADREIHESRRLQLVTYINTLRPACKACLRDGYCEQQKSLK